MQDRRGGGGEAFHSFDWAGAGCCDSSRTKPLDDDDDDDDALAIGFEVSSEDESGALVWGVDRWEGGGRLGRDDRDRGCLIR